MQISELARLTGASTKAVRYYEDLGLLEPLRLPNGYRDYRFGVPPKKTYREVFTTDLPAYGGTGDWRNEGELLTESIPSHGKPCSLCVTIPPLGAVVLRLG